MAEEEDDEEDREDDAEGEEGEDGEGEGEGSKKPDLKKLILFIGLPAVIVILAGVAAALLLLGGGEPDEAEAGEQAEEPAVLALPAILWERSMVVNISGEGGRSALLQIEFALAYDDPAITQVLNQRHVEDRLRSDYVEFLRTLRVEDLYGSMGTFRVRAEMLRRANLILAPARVEEVLLTGMVLQ